MVLCLNLNMKNPVSALRMEMGDCYITELPSMVTAFTKILLET